MSRLKQLMTARILIITKLRWARRSARMSKPCTTGPGYKRVKAACAVCRDHQASTLQDLLQNYCPSAYHTCVQQSISCAELNDSYQCCHQGAVKQNTQQQRTCSKQTSDRLSHHSEMTSSPGSKQIQSEPCTALFGAFVYMQVKGEHTCS